MRAERAVRRALHLRCFAEPGPGVEQTWGVEISQLGRQEQLHKLGREGTAEFNLQYGMRPGSDLFAPSSRLHQVHPAADVVRVLRFPRPAATRKEPLKPTGHAPFSADGTSLPQEPDPVSTGAPIRLPHSVHDPS